jgi:hypothetical protein
MIDMTIELFLFATVIPPDRRVFKIARMAGKCKICRAAIDEAQPLPQI